MCVKGRKRGKEREGVDQSYLTQIAELLDMMLHNTQVKLCMCV